MPFINITRKFVFIANARTGSTSIYNYLNQTCKNDKIVWDNGISAKPHLYHMNINNTIKKYPFCKDYVFFCFVRNPYTRFLSSYVEFTDVKSHHEWSAELLNFKNFKEFCLKFNNTKIKDDIHFKSLTQQIKSDITINLYICRFENFYEDFNKISNIINIPNNISIHNRKTNYSKKKSNFYDEETKMIIQEFYKEDFITFNYSMDINDI